MRNRPLAIMLLVNLSGGLAAQATPPRSVDARTLDVARVTTEMNYDQVVAALAGRFQVPPAEIKPTLSTARTW